MNQPEINKESIPYRANLCITAVLLLSLLGLIVSLSFIQSWWAIALICIGYALVMNASYAMLHEAEHRILHPNLKINDLAGVILALFFPAPFHLIRQGHIGHHMRNRSDDEAFDFYFDGESRVWKHLQFYGILTGLFWLVVVLSNLIALLTPSLLQAKWSKFDRPTEALLESLNKKYLIMIRLEALLVISLHASMIYFLGIPFFHYAIMLCSFGVLWSTLQYIHHFGTDRDVLKGAKNLKTWRWLDWLWLNHNWHKNHHAEPTVSWIHLPEVDPEAKLNEENRERLLPAYLKMWRGPRHTKKRVENHYAGKIIR